MFSSELTSYCLYATINFIGLIFVPPRFCIYILKILKRGKGQKYVPRWPCSSSLVRPTPSSAMLLVDTADTLVFPEVKLQIHNFDFKNGDYKKLNLLVVGFLIFSINFVCKSFFVFSVNFAYISLGI